MFRFQPLALDPACRRRGCVRNILEVLCCRLLLCLLCRLHSQRHSTCRVAFCRRARVERLPECAAAPSSARAREVPGVFAKCAHVVRVCGGIDEGPRLKRSIEKC